MLPLGLFKTEFGSAGPSCHCPVSSARLFLVHGVSHSCLWPLAGCDGGWDSSRDTSGDSLQAVVQQGQGAVHVCISGYPGLVPSNRERQEFRILSVSLYVFFVLSLQGMTPSSSNVPESCRSGSCMREVTSACCHPGTGRVPQLPVCCGEGVSAPGPRSSWREQRWSQPSHLPGRRDHRGLINASGRLGHEQNRTPGKALCSSVYTGLMPNSELCHLSEQFVLKKRRRSCFLEGVGWL